VGDLESIDEQECRALLAAHGIGRLAIGGIAHIVPVNYAMDGDDVVLRSTSGIKSDAIARGAVVAFEVDEIDLVYHTGWSVMVTGVASLVRDPATRARLATLPLRSWVDSSSDWIRIVPVTISGRRLTLNRGRAVRATP